MDPCEVDWEFGVFVLVGCELCSHSGDVPGYLLGRRFSDRENPHGTRHKQGYPDDEEAKVHDAAPIQEIVNDDGTSQAENAYTLYLYWGRCHVTLFPVYQPSLLGLH